MWDALAGSEIADAIPIAKYFVKGWRAVRDIRASLFASKLLKFITDPSLQTAEARARARQRSRQNWTVAPLCLQPTEAV